MCISILVDFTNLARPGRILTPGPGMGMLSSPVRPGTKVPARPDEGATGLLSSPTRPGTKVPARLDEGATGAFHYIRRTRPG